MRYLANNHSSLRLKGILLAITGACLWGLGGTVSDFLFKHHNIDIDWYVTARLVISGIFLLIMYKMIQPKRSIFSVFQDRQMLGKLLIFSILGMLVVQYAYMASINTGNAAIATLLQYIAPVYIIVWFVLRGVAKLTLFDVLAIVMTLVGTFLLLTNGSFSNLVVNPASLFWGILAGVALAFYTIYPSELLNRYGSILIVGWAMLISGIAMNLRHPIWQINISEWGLSTILFLLFGIIGGTALAFYFFIDSLQYISAKETTLFGTVEPVVAVIASSLWLHVAFKSFQIVGIILIMILILLLSLKKQPKEIHE
ncbi:TPA: EamA family transporter [Staphylococcus argenteus]|uniref:DMT family transporter n=1 Tax=Staphylococcus argenteus TaxID=985002 RepID=UPI000504A85D|nr:DMT family transporter [Staphylococcus argenteus]MBE2136493.1 EamA family transporter [Staphylococcus argenteus]MDT3005904.1 DMT family transporter [Staphylococcus argenteus]UPO20695.1 DMT family transporter [Staphylococcus argenteus]CDR64216.1 drug/metabolite exporter family transporter [Staphylococcus argenteus]HDY9446388.1 EamA family transporter [Staphylococcus argenteus]